MICEGCSLVVICGTVEYVPKSVALNFCGAIGGGWAGMIFVIVVLVDNVFVGIAVVVVVEIVDFCRLMDWFPLSTNFGELVVDWEGYTYVRNDLTLDKFCR